MSTENELQTLKNKRAGLDEELHSLEEKEKSLELRVKIVEEEIAIRHLEETSESKRQAIKQLESKISELEGQLSKSPTEPEMPAKAEPPSPSTEAVSETFETVVEEPIEEEVTIATLEEPIRSISAETFEEDTKKKEKKKRKLF